MAERGSYVALTELKRAMGEAATTNDAAMLQAAEDASRYLDGKCERKFFVQTATRYYTARHSGILDLEPGDDLLSVTTIKTDTSGDRTYATTWAASDFDLMQGSSYNRWPKSRIVMAPNGSYNFLSSARGVEVTGSWGYGDGESASPWKASGLTITVATADGTTLTASAATPAFSAGQTLLVGTEQVYLTAVSGATLTAERGVNGTTAATHAAAAASIAQYPSGIRRAALMIAEQMHRIEGAPFGVAGSPEMAIQTMSHDQQVFVLRVFEQYRLVVVG